MKLVDSIRAQICFAKDADLSKVRTQLEDLAKKEDLSFYCCFLSRRHVIEKGFSLDIVNLLEDTLGKRLIFMTDAYDTFAEVMENMERIRQTTANVVNRMYVLDSGTAAGVAKEIELFTNCKVILMP